MHPQHAALLAELKGAGRGPVMPPPGNDSYGASGRPCFFVPVPRRRAIARAWAAAHRGAAAGSVLDLVDSLLAGETYEERALAGLVLAYHRKARAAAQPADLDRWLHHVNGWAEVDGLCQSLFPASQLLADWRAWSALLESLAADASPNRRRAALVLLTGPVKADGDSRLAELAFAIVRRLGGERDPLVAKAVSWLLRALTEKHAASVADFLNEAGGRLPAAAVRETRIKLATGVKRGRLADA